MEEFFKISNSLDLIEVEELLLRKYSNLDYILKLEFLEGYEFIANAYRKDLEERLWQKWLVDYRYMTKENFISFEEYKEKVFGSDNQEQSNLSKEEILRQAEEIENKSRKKRGD